MKINILLSAGLAIAASVAVNAQDVGLPVIAPGTEGTAADTTQLETRVNPQIEGDGVAPAASTDYSKYPFLRLTENHIMLNGADWTKLRQRLADIDNEVFSLVHIGDSHLQAEGATSCTRALMQATYGSAGRGLVTPFKLAGTNQPADYSISSTSAFTTAMLMRKPWKSEMGFTGISLTPSTDKFDFTITTKPIQKNIGDTEYKDDQNFDYIKMYVRGAMPKLVSASNGVQGNVKFTTEAKGDTLAIWLNEPVTNIKLNFASEGTCQIFGFKLENSMVGFEYHVIGNNGARYDTYTSLGNTGRDIKTLAPNLVVISMGANEAFGEISDNRFYNNIETLVSDIRTNNPDAEILLVTPAECQRKTDGGFIVVNNVERLRNVILKYGADTGTPVYDWYEVAGGKGSSAHWVSKGLFSRDRIHNTLDGYVLQGYLFYDALRDALDPQPEQ